MLDLFEKSLVFVTHASIKQIVLETPSLFTAWQIANLYLGSLDLPGLDGQRVRLVGLSEGTTFYVSTAYFALRLFPAYLTPSIPYVVVCLALYAALLLVSKLRVGRIVLPHTHLSRMAGAVVVVAVFASFLMDTTWIFRGVIALYGVAIVEQIAMIARYGDIPLDTRSILWLRRGGRGSAGRG